MKVKQVSENMFAICKHEWRQRIVGCSSNSFYCVHCLKQIDLDRQNLDEEI